MQKTDRRRFLKGLGVAAGACVLPQIAAAQNSTGTEKPNILFMMVDDLGKEWVKCYGAENIETPNIDALAKAGMKFTNAYSMPQCTPSRTTLLTGQYPWRTGWTNHWDVPRWGVGYFDWKHNTSVARVMKSAGYATVAAGKWQINDFRIEPEAMRKHGFDDWCMWTGYESQVPASAERYWNAHINTPKDGSKTYKSKFGPDIYADYLINFIGKHKKEPMFLYFPMALTHGPLTTTPDEPDVTDGKAKHIAMVHYTDKLLGRMVDAIEKNGLSKNTIIIFTTDNGTGGGNSNTINGHVVRGGKAQKSENGVCNPFIVSCPGTVPAGVTTDALTDFSDLLPTFAELGGAQLPKDTPIDGASFAPLILGKAKDSPREWILGMGHGAGRCDEEGIRGVFDYADRVIRDKQYKVWVNEQGTIDQLYDLKADPFEKNNLIESTKPAHKKALAKFQKVVDAMPKVDLRPKYDKRTPNPWDKKPSGPPKIPKAKKK